MVFIGVDLDQIDKMVPRRVKSAPGAIELNQHFGAESYSDQRERKSVWQGFQYKSKIGELVSGKLSPSVYIYTVKRSHLITSPALNECLLVHNFHNRMSKLHRMSMRNAKEYRSMTAQ